MNSLKSISPLPSTSTSAMAASSYCWVYMPRNSSPANNSRSSLESIYPLPSLSNIWKAVLRYDSRVKVYWSIVAAKNSRIWTKGERFYRENRQYIISS